MFGVFKFYQPESLKKHIFVNLVMNKQSTSKCADLQVINKTNPLSTSTQLDRSHTHEKLLSYQITFYMSCIICNLLHEDGSIVYKTGKHSDSFYIFRKSLNQTKTHPYIS